MTFNKKNLPHKWLLLSINSLLFAGIISLIVVFSRVPVIKDLLNLKSLFIPALVAHVNLSQIFWMLSISAMLSIIYIGSNKMLSSANFYLAALAVILMILSPFLYHEKAMLNNYIPVIESLSYFFALAFLLTSILIISTSSIFLKKTKNSTAQTAIITNNLIIIFSFIIFILTYYKIAQFHDGFEFYEYIFWGMGHILQYSYTLLMLFSIVIISKYLKIPLILSDKKLNILWILHLIITFSAIAFFIFETGMQYKAFFTFHMILGNSLIAIIITPYFLLSLRNVTFPKTDEAFALRYSLYFAILLFAVGGILGITIRESNTIIPAHYHGSTVGVTMSLMALTYYLLPRLGYQTIKGRIARLQPLIYGGGQLLHILSLAMSGKYGALRKSPDSIISLGAKIWMGMMGIGGLAAMIGGILFIIICYQSILTKQQKVK